MSPKIIGIDEEEDDFDNSVRYDTELDSSQVLLAKPTKQHVSLTGGFYSGRPLSRKRIDLFRKFQNQQKTVSAASKDDMQNDHSEEGSQSDDEMSSEEESDDLLSTAASLYSTPSSSKEDTDSKKKLKNTQSVIVASSAEEEMKNAQRVLSQKRSWTTLVQTRISLSKLFTLINRLPQPQTSAFQFINSSDKTEKPEKSGKAEKPEKTDALPKEKTVQPSPALNASLKRARAAAKSLLGSFLEIQKSFSRTVASEKSISSISSSNSSSGKKPSSLSDEVSSYLSSSMSLRKLCRPKIASIADAAHMRASIAKSLAPTMSRKMSGSSMALLRNLQLPISTQVANITREKERMLLRMHTNRVGAVPIGTETDPAAQKKEKPGSESGSFLDVDQRELLKKKEINRYIVDDNDFYQMLIRSLLRSTAATTVAQQIDEDNFADGETTNKSLALPSSGFGGFLSSLEIETAQASLIATQKLQHKAKQAFINRRATKGREMKYTVHPQIVSFMSYDEKPFPKNTDVVLSNLFSG